jgi:ParB/RepB/Spo0J family partition protein
MSEKSNSRVKWKISRLKEHPRQAEMFGDVSDEEIKELAADMRRHGQRQAVEVQPDGTILGGHQRVRAARLLGWKEIDVVVRHDLVEDATAAEAFFINDNLVRRHLSQLARARCIKRLVDLDPNTKQDHKKEEVKRRVAARLDLSLRSVDRYLLVLKAPREIQAAFDRSEINLTQAGKVAVLTLTQAGKVEAQKIAKRIRQGEKAAKVLAEALARGGCSADAAGMAFGRLVMALKRELPQLDGHEISARRLGKSLPTLRSARQLLDRFIAQAEPPAE